MGFQYEGEIYSLTCSIVWAFAVVLFRLSGQRVAPLALNLFKNTVAVILFIITIAALGYEFLPEVGWINYLLLAVSGMFGLAIADTLYFRSLNVLGAGLLAIVGCLYSPSVVFFSVIFLHEKLSAGDIVGAAMILSSVVLSSGHTRSAGVGKRQLVSAIILGAISMILMGLGVAVAKPALNRSPVIWATALRLFTATIMLAFISSLSSGRRATWSCFRPSAAWKVTVPASVVGAYVAMVLWIAGIKYTLASVAAILNQTSVVFVLILAGLLLNERITVRKMIAVAMAVTGIVLVTLA